MHGMISQLWGSCHQLIKFLCHSTHKIVGISTISWAAHATAQTRELACTKYVLPQVIDVVFMCVEFHMSWVRAIGLHVVEIAHDIQVQVAKYIRETLGLVNSYDIWHGIFVFQQHNFITLLAINVYFDDV